MLDQNTGHYTNNGKIKLENLREASVALNGKIIVEGTMIYPDDKEGLFIFPESMHVSISRLGNKIKIQRCHAVRHSSGFYLDQSYGAVLTLPTLITDVLRNCLKYQHDLNGTEFNKEYHSLDGLINIQEHCLEKNNKRISKWKVSSIRSEEYIHFDIYGCLDFEQPTSQLSVRENKYWEDENWVHVHFKVSTITCLACFSGKLPDFNEEYNPTRSVLSPLIDLKIEKALVGPFCSWATPSLFASDGTKWYMFESHTSEMYLR